MKVTYRNSDTTTIEIETSEEIAVTLTESYRKEDKVWLGSANMAMSNSLDSTIGIESPAVYAYFMDQIRRSGLLCPENELQLGFDDPVYDGKPVCAAEDFDELDDDE